MKKTYKTPKAKLVNFCYDEQVIATSGGIAHHGDPMHIGRCQQSSETSCVHFWTAEYGAGTCQANPLSVPGFPVGM